MHGRWLILPMKFQWERLITYKCRNSKEYIIGNEVLITYTYPNSPGSEHVHLVAECHVVQSYNQKLNINKVHVHMWRFFWNPQKEGRKKEERLHTTVGHT